MTKIGKHIKSTSHYTQRYRLANEESDRFVVPVNQKKETEIMVSSIF